MKYDSRADTLDHIGKVRIFIDVVIKNLMSREQYHDASKLVIPEKEYFDEWTPKLSSVKYGSNEYRNMLGRMRPAIDHHQQNNRHHPEYFGDKGMLGMDLIDLIEMLCDWKAATLRHQDGDLNKSLEINKKRWGDSEKIGTISLEYEYLFELLERTAKNLGFI